MSPATPAMPDRIQQTGLVLPPCDWRVKSGFTPHRQAGFAAVAAIFLVVVLAALGGFMLTFSNTQQLTSAQDLQGMRAFWAARAGLEWGVAKAVGTTPTCAASTTLSASFDGGFSVTVSCTSTTYTDGAATTLYTITSTATSTGAAVGSIGYSERSMTATVELP